ncbi:MAG: helix-turn-helix domain-containing protein [Opitutales bacterium]
MSTNGGQTVGELLRAYREEEGLKVRKAAALADMDPSALSRIENDRRQPTAAQLAVLAEIYGKPLESLLTVQIYSEIKTKYGQLEQFPDTVKMLYEDAAEHGKRKVGSE